MNLPCMRDKCIGKECGNFNDPSSKFFNKQMKLGCKGGEYPPWSWARWYNNQLPKIAERVYREREMVNTQGNLKAMEARQ